jgi:hypothetical protein
MNGFLTKNEQSVKMCQKKSLKKDKFYDTKENIPTFEIQKWGIGIL